MYKNVTSGPSSASPAQHGGSSPGLDSQESPWVGLLSVLSRPALSLLNRIVPGRTGTVTRTAALPGPDPDPNRGPGWLSGLLDDLESSERSGAAALLEAGPGSCLPWLPAGLLQGLGDMEDMGDMDLRQHPRLRCVSTVRTTLHQVLLNAQKVQAGGGKDWGSPSVGDSRGSHWWRGDGGILLQDAFWTDVTGQNLCPQQPAALTKAAGSSWTGAEPARAPDPPDGPVCLPQGPLDPPERPGLFPDRLPQRSTVIQQLCIRTDPDQRGASLPTPDQDNGYSSLEEELVQKCPLLMATPLRQEEVVVEEEEEVGTEAGEESVLEVEESVEVLAPPRCQNRDIAFIMGCPCSDDDSQSESTDDGGFDSEASSDSSSSEDEEEEEEEEEELDEEAERLWHSLSRSRDPYNPQNFCARLHTFASSSSSQPQDVPDTSSRSPPGHASSPLASSSSPLACATSSSPLACTSSSSPDSSWDDSASASEVDEAESLHLWHSFSCSSDPYSPLNFQAPLRTRAPPAAPLRAKKTSQTPLAPPVLHPDAPPQYRKEGAEERLDSGFSEPCSTSSDNYRLIKKVRFSDQVEEFFASSGDDEEEDRRGPWEEFARDRCRFLRRCLEVEQSISFCLQPQHRQLVFQRLSVLRR